MGYIKTRKFSKPVYVGDPINAVRIFNEKEVDELVILDIDASKENRGPSFNEIADITGEAFMPVAYGGGVTSIEQAEKLFFNGVEKIIINSALFTHPGLVKEIASRYGAQSVIASVDFKKSVLGKRKVYSHSSRKIETNDILQMAQKAEQLGAGELMLNSVDRDGMYMGYDTEILSEVAKRLQIPVIVCGGASDKSDFTRAENNGASAMAAGSMFVFQRPHNAVLISYDI